MLYSERMSQEEYTTILQTSSWILRPLSKLKGLKTFFAHLDWPFAWTEAGQAEYLKNPGSAGERIQVSEQSIEQLVMGSDYNSITLQKGQPRKSQWLEVASSSIEQA